MVERIPTDELLAHLREIDAETDGVLTRRELEAHGGHNPSTYARRFGSWNAAKEAAGLGTNRSTAEVGGCSDDELLTHLRELDAETDGVLTCRKMDTHGDYAGATYAARFGTWCSALKQAGLDVTRKRGRRVSDTELLEHLRDVDSQTDGSVTIDQMNDLGNFSANTYHNRFGSWNAAKEAAGLESTIQGSRIETEALVADLRDLAAMFDDQPLKEDVRSFGTYSVPTYVNRFGSWEAALEAANLGGDGE